MPLTVGAGDRRRFCAAAAKGEGDQRAFIRKSTRHLHPPTDNPAVLTRSRSDLRARLAQESDAPPVRRLNKADASVTPREPVGPDEAIGSRSGLAPHIDQELKLDFGFLLRQAQQLDADRAKKLMKVAEKRAPKRRFSSKPIGAAPALAAQLKSLEPGETFMVPFHAIRPGQAQLSFAHAGTKVAKFLSKLDGHTPENLTALAEDLGLLEVPCLIGPGGAYAVIHDRHHHMSGLLALIGWTDNLTNQGHALHMGKPGPELATLQALFGNGVPHVQVVVTENLSHLSEREFLEAATPYLDRETSTGKVASTLPARFTDLEDNPFRNLASTSKIKVERTGDGKRDFELEAQDGDDGLWIKPPSAPDFIEFHVGKVFSAAFDAAGRRYDPTKALSADDRNMLRDALKAAQDDPEHASHEVLQEVVIKPADVSLDDLKGKIRVGRKRGHVRFK